MRVLQTLLIICLLAVPSFVPAKQMKGDGIAELPARSHPASCKVRAAVMLELYQRFNESVRGTGTDHDGQIELLYSPGGRTFTIVLHRPDGMSCYLAWGENWLAKR